MYVKESKVGGWSAESLGLLLSACRGSLWMEVDRAAGRHFNVSLLNWSAATDLNACRGIVWFQPPEARSWTCFVWKNLTPRLTAFLASMEMRRTVACAGKSSKNKTFGLLCQFANTRYRVGRTENKVVKGRHIKKLYHIIWTLGNTMFT